ncbi:hypothetical protein A2U01_0059442, partial [Trifolium medium]|nr:hypothetical protein [Trifolium medium]
MMSSACCNALVHNHILLSRSVILSPQPTALQFQSPSSLLLPPIRSPPPFNQLSFRRSRLSAFSDDGSGGAGGTGGDGGSGGWNSGGNESD